MNLALAGALARGFAAANGLRLALTLGCIALGVALAGAVHTVHNSALAEIDRAARSLSGTADLELRGARSGFDDALFARVAALDEVAAASPILEVQAALAGTEETLRVLGVDPLRAIRLQPAFVASSLQTSTAGVGELLDEEALWLSPAAATRLRAAPGTKIALLVGTRTREYRVTGVLSGLHAAGPVAVMDIAAAQAHFDRLGKLSRIELRLRPGADATRVRARLEGLVPPGVVVSGSASISGRAEEISRAYRVNLNALALIALATGAFLVFSTLALQAARRRQELALLRALGLTRRALTLLLAIEGGAMGLVGATLGTALGLFASRAILLRSGGDLGAGFFEDLGGLFAPDPASLAIIALLGVAVAVAGALWVARAVGRMPVAEALRDRAVDLPLMQGRHSPLALALALAGVPLLFVPAVAGLPLGGYAAIALWLAAAVVAVPPLCRASLARIAPRDAPIASLALSQVRHLPGHLTASVAGIVVSVSLCAAMAIMVHSFRVSFEQWLRGVVGADVYARASLRGDSGFFTLEQQQRVARLPEVASVEAVRFDRLTLSGSATPLTLVVRPIDERILAGFQARPAGMPANRDTIPVWISEAARDLHGWKPGDRLELPIEGRRVPVRVEGLIRDYARTWGAVLFPVEDYRRLTGDARAHDLGIHLKPGIDPQAAQASIRAALGDTDTIALEDAAGIHRRSLQLFDRSFAVTYALETIAAIIALAGVTSSFAALAWSRRREFGVLRFLGLTRREILAMLALEGGATGALGTLVGLVSGAAISLVLIRVVNRQSFHWEIEVHWPAMALAVLAAAIVVACSLGARLSAAVAVRREAVLAVKDDA